MKWWESFIKTIETTIIINDNSIGFLLVTKFSAIAELLLPILKIVSPIKKKKNLKHKHSKNKKYFLRLNNVVL